MFSWRCGRTATIRYFLSGTFFDELGWPTVRYFLAREVQPFFDNVMSQDVLSGHNEISFFMGKDPKLPSAVFFGGVSSPPAAS